MVLQLLKPSKLVGVTFKWGCVMRNSFAAPVFQACCCRICCGQSWFGRVDAENAVNLDSLTLLGACGQWFAQFFGFGLQVGSHSDSCQRMGCCGALKNGSIKSVLVCSPCALKFYNIGRGLPRTDYLLVFHFSSQGWNFCVKDHLILVAKVTFIKARLNKFHFAR